MNPDVANNPRVIAAKERVAKAQAAFDAAKAKTGDGQFDHGVLSGVRRKPSARMDLRRFDAYDREAKAAVELKAAADALVGEITRAACEAHDAKTKALVTPETLATATHVRVIYGWREVVRVNEKTVTIHGDFGLIRVPHKQVLEVRRVTE